MFAKQAASRDADCRSVHLLRAGVARILNSEVALHPQPDGKGQPLRAIASWGLGPPHERIARQLEGGLVGHALGAKRVALGPIGGCRHGLRSEPARDGVGVPAPGFASIALHADSWR
jgi:hypothetical protein